MALTGGTAPHPAAPHIGAAPSTGGTPPRTPVRKAAGQRVQRYLNKGTGRMEALKHGHFPGARPTGQKPAQRVAQRRAGRPPTAPAKPAAGGKSLIQMSPAEIEAHARSIVGSELNAERLPFTQRQTALAGQEYGQEQAHTQTYQKLDTALEGQQTHAGETAKTAQNVAAEAVKRAEAQAPGAEQAAEHGAGGEALAKQQAAAKTLLTAIASAAQGGTNARQQGEADFLTNMRASAAQEGAAGAQQIAGEYGRAKQDTANKQAELEAGRQGRVGKLSASLLGERDKLQIAAQGLGIKGAEAERHAGEAKSKAAHQGRADRLAEKAQKSKEQHERADEGYKAAGQGQKERKDKLDIRKKEVEIKKALEGNPSSGGGKPLTTNEINVLAGEGARTFNVFLRQHEKGVTFGKIRQEIKGLKQPVWLDAAQQIVEKGYIGAQTKQALREMGLPDGGWSNRFWPSRAAKTQNAQGAPPILPPPKRK